jgi:hypothetical protein
MSKQSLALQRVLPLFWNLRPSTISPDRPVTIPNGYGGEGKVA